MTHRDDIRIDLKDDKLVPQDRRTNQVRGEVDINNMDADQLGELRDEDITNLDENELDQLDAEIGVRRNTEEGSDMIPGKRLDRELARQQDSDREDVE